MIADRPEIRAFQTHELTADWGYASAFMAHAVAGATTPRPNWGNGPPASGSWPVTETYVYFNNDWEGFAPRNARRLRRLLEYAGSD